MLNNEERKKNKENYFVWVGKLLYIIFMVV